MKALEALLHEVEELVEHTGMPMSLTNGREYILCFRQVFTDYDDSGPSSFAAMSCFYFPGMSQKDLEEWHKVTNLWFYNSLDSFVNNKSLNHLWFIKNDPKFKGAADAVDRHFTVWDWNKDGGFNAVYEKVPLDMTSTNWSVTVESVENVKKYMRRVAEELAAL